MQPIFYPDWREKAAFYPDRPRPAIWLEDEKIKVISGSLEAGQMIPTHPEALAVYHFLCGTGWMNVAGERFRVQPGATVIAPQGAARGVEAETQLVFLAVRIA